MKSKTNIDAGGLSPELQNLLDATRPFGEVTDELKREPIDFERDPNFLAGRMKADIVEHLLRAMEQRNLNGSQLAENLGKSRQWVSRILNETDNFTVDTIAKLACAVGKRPFINLIDHGEMIRIMPFKTEWEAIYNHEMRDHVSSSFVFQAAESGEVFCSSHFENLPSHENSEESLDNFDELSRAA